MDDELKNKLRDEIIAEIRSEYMIVHKDHWRAYTCRTIAALVVVGGVTTAAVLGVIWSGTGSAARATIEHLLAKSTEHHDAMEKMRKGWENGVISGNVEISGNLTCNGKSWLRSAEIAEQLQVGSGGTAITMNRDKIVMGYGGVDEDGARKAGIVMGINEDNANRADIQIRDKNGDGLRSID